LAPENTLPAFEKALEIGTDLVEIDVRLTQDGHVVVMHDNRLDRTTDRTGAISQCTLRQIKAADAGIQFDARFRGTRVPTLEETLDLLRGKALALIEIKAEGITERVVNVVKQMQAQNGVVLQSFNAQTVQDVAKTDPSLPTALLVGAQSEANQAIWAIDLARQLGRVHANLAGLAYSTVTPEIRQELHLRGFCLWVWTVDEISDLEQMIALPVDGIISNFPDRLNAALGRTP
jgi:glycerophosphoryl diester phosphodiesterase